MPNRPEQIETAVELMVHFAERTGLSSDRPEQRYLWTDAFAVSNFLGLARTTRDARYMDLALRLVDRVHAVLGQHRADDSRRGWISGLGAEDGAAHPTRGGLRIGKDLPERRANEPFDERLEWDRDGQYFHYLTQWMHALDQVTRATAKPVYNAWARELAQTAFRAFTYMPGGGTERRMYWKMSIDLSRPLVPSMGQHDALDGYVTCVELQQARARSTNPTPGPDLADETAGFASMMEGHDLGTDDPLGIGGLLVDAFRIERLTRQGAIHGAPLLANLFHAALQGMRVYARHDELRLTAARRLAFRELGLAIGLHSVALMDRSAASTPPSFPGGADARADLDALGRYVSLGIEIEAFWLSPEHREASSWLEHRNINDVMLATSLAPDGFLGLE